MLTAYQPSQPGPFGHSCSFHKPVAVIDWLLTTLRLSAMTVPLHCCSCALAKEAGC